MIIFNRSETEVKINKSKMIVFAIQIFLIGMMTACVLTGTFLMASLVAILNGLISYQMYREHKEIKEDLETF